MTRSSRTPRQLVAGGETYLWSVRHEHQGQPGRYEQCREVLTFRRPGALGRLQLVFEGSPGHHVPDGRTPSGEVGTESGAWLNLHEPGAVQALLDAALSRGVRVAGDRAEEIDGWNLLEAATRRT